MSDSLQIDLLTLILARNQSLQLVLVNLDLMLSAHANLLRKDLFSFGAALARLLPPCNCVDLLRTVVVSETILSGQVRSVVLFLALTFFLRRLLQTNVLEVGLLNAFF